MTIKIKKLSNEKVQEIPGTTEVEDKRPIKGYDCIPDMYNCISSIARTKSGKSFACGHLIKQCATKHTTVLIFSGSLYTCKTQIRLRKYFKKHNIPYCGYTSIIQEGVNILKELTDALTIKAKIREEEEDKNKPKENECVLFNDDDSDDDSDEKKCKYQAPEYIIFFDDLKNEVRSTPVQTLIQFHRHWRCKVIIASQYVYDIHPSSYRNLNYFMLFKGSNIKDLEKIFSEFGLEENITFNNFIRLYEYATKPKYSFFFIDTREGKFRKNFDELIEN
jgi:hypothetical protein